MPEITIPYNWRPRPYQMPLWKYLENGGKRAVGVWHRRAGKDDVCLHWAATAAMQRPATYWHMLPEASQARKAIWEAINPHTGKRRIEEAFPKEIISTMREQEMLVKFVTGATWQVVGSDNFDSLVGSPPAGVVFSEWAIAKPDAWAYLRPILAENGGWAAFIYTPRGGNHGKTTYDFAVEEKDWFAQLLTVEDTGVFTQAQIEAEKREMIKQYGPSRGLALFNQEYFCSWTQAFTGKTVYPEFIHKFHVTTEPLLPIVYEAIVKGADPTIIRGWDHTGLHPGCVITWVAPSGQWMIIKEFWHEDCVIEDFARGIQAWCGQNLPSKCTYKDFGDPAGKNRDSRKKSPAQYLRETCGIHIQEGIQTFKIRREAVAGRLTRQIMGGPALVVDPTQCPILIDGFLGGYGYKEIGTTGLFHDEPIKDKYADVHDSLQYPASRIFSNSIFQQSSREIMPDYVEAY